MISVGVRNLEKALILVIRSDGALPKIFLKVLPMRESAVATSSEGNDSVSIPPDPSSACDDAGRPYSVGRRFGISWLVGLIPS